MATETMLEKLLKENGITADDIASINLGSAEEASERSLRAFASSKLGKSTELEESMGTLHFTGPAIKGHSAPIEVIGNTLSNIQNVMNSIGASIKGFGALGGPIPLTITDRTELMMIASPLPGSVVIHVQPKMNRRDDLYPGGDPMFDLEEEIGAKPLADECFEKFIEIMSSTSDDSPEHETLIDLLSDLGPRTSSSIRTFCDSLGKDGLNLDVKWQEPDNVSLESNIQNERAKTMSEFIKNADIESNEVDIYGTLITSTLSPKDKLRILKDDGSEITIRLGKISKAEIAAVRPGDKVTIHADCKVGKYAGGRTSTTYAGLSIRSDAQLPLE